jgi:ribonuclease HI
MHDLDVSIDKKLDGFRHWFSQRMKDADAQTRRRAGGICLLGDIQPKSLDELPFRLKPKKGFRTIDKTITVSTDGSVLKASRFAKDKAGPGGWAAVFHDGREIKGGEDNTTNNRMELKAAIEALKFVSVGSHILIRTDSSYVYRTSEKGDIIKKNIDLWNQFNALRDERRVKVIWIKGHGGDPQNEKADQLANQEAGRIKGGH